MHRNGVHMSHTENHRASNRNAILNMNRLLLQEFMYKAFSNSAQLHTHTSQFSELSYNNIPIQ